MWRSIKYQLVVFTFQTQKQVSHHHVYKRRETEGNAQSTLLHYAVCHIGCRKFNNSLSIALGWGDPTIYLNNNISRRPWRILRLNNPGGILPSPISSHPDHLKQGFMAICRKPFFCLCQLCVNLSDLISSKTILIIPRELVVAILSCVNFRKLAKVKF